MKKLTEAFNSLPINLNQIELHLSSSDAHLQNSRGVDVRTQKTNAFLQIVVTTEGSSGEQEYLYSQNFGALKQIDPEQIAACCATMVRDQADAVTTKSFSGPVLLSGPALTEFFSPHIDLSPLIAHASARLAHMQLSSYRKGRPILKSTKGDRLTLISNPLIPFNPGSSRFDADGVPSRILTLVDRGMFCGWFASQRYAHYLDVPATGSLGCIQVGLGSRAESSLRDGCYAEVVSLSSFTPNSISGDFSAEVRLGYFHKNGKKYPFRGGLFSGNVFDLMKHVYFSNSPITADGYCGPSLVRFEKGIISGE
ncbi:MAG: metallopeptidase TldD-related protein [Nanoarchaeota archaeon]